MHGLPKNVDLSFLLNKDLLQICIGQNETILNFDDGVSICIETEIHCESTDGTAITCTGASDVGSRLAAFLACSVVEATGQEDGTLRLKFSNGGSVEIRDNSKQYESYVIHHHDKEIIV